MPRQRVPRQTLGDRIVSQLRSEIESGQYGRGDRLPSQRQLAAECGVSINIVREALRTLQTAGFIEIHHGTGMFVAKRFPQFNWNSQELDHHTVAEARRLLEIGAIEQVIRRIDDAGLARLEAILERAEPKEKTHQSTFDEELDFHRALLELTENAAVTQLSHIIEQYFIEELKDLPPELSGTYPFVTEHRKIVDLIRAADVDGARRVLRDHILTLPPHR